MAKYSVYVPPTMDQIEYDFVCTDNFISVAKDALQNYNSARAHDGQPPLNRMPKSMSSLAIMDTVTDMRT